MILMRAFGLMLRQHFRVAEIEMNLHISGEAVRLIKVWFMTLQMVG